MRRTASPIAAATLALFLLVAGCAGDDESTAPTSAPADSGTEAPADSGIEAPADSGTEVPAGGDLDAFCAVDAQLNSEVFADYQPGQPLTEEQTALLEEAKATAPDAVSAQVSAIVDVLTGADPTSEESNQTLAEGGNEVDAFVAENC